MFYFTENIYKKICALDLARELEINSNFRNIYNMILMLPLLPVNTIQDGLNNVEIQAKDLDLENLTEELFVHVRNEWINKVTPELFCIHRSGFYFKFKVAFFSTITLKSHFKFPG